MNTRVALLNIGTELLRGRTVNTNASFIGEYLIVNGFALETTLVIHDDGPIIQKSIEDLLAQHEVVLLTGGLGPTKDDITKKILLELFGGEMVCHQSSLARIEGYLSRLGRPLLEHNRQQAFVPSSCEVLENEMGTAPGMAFTSNGKLVISMPGVPFEMKHLMKNKVLPFMQMRFPTQLQLQRIVRTAGIPESRIAEKMEEIESELHPEIAIAYLPSFDGTKIELKRKADENLRAEVETSLEFAQERVAKLFQKYVYSLEDKSPDQLLAELLRCRNATFATAESCTGGGIAAKLVENSGMSAILKGGIVAYMPEIKTRVLAVSETTIDTFGIVSEEVAKGMAEGARKFLGADYAVSITGIAEAAKDAAQDEQPQAWIAFAGPNGTVAYHQKLMKDRVVNIQIAIQVALIFALRNLQNLESFI